MPTQAAEWSLTRRGLLTRAIAAGLLASQGLPAVVRTVCAAPVAGPGLRAAQLLAVCRTLFPHDFLGDDTYAIGAQHIEDKAAADPAAATVIEQALAALPADFSSLDQTARELALRALAKQEFVPLARQSTVAGVYGTPAVWTHFSYPGPSVAFGGYVDRPLVDLPWIEHTQA